MNKKYIAYVIQASLILIVVLVGYFASESIKHDEKVTSTSVHKEVLPDSVCPPATPRNCLFEAYSTETIECPLIQDECNAQTIGTFCYKVTWKDKKVKECKHCNESPGESFLDREYVKCKN